MTDKSSNIAIAETLFNADPAVTELGLELVASEPGSVTIALNVEDRHLNFNGTCHGGVIFTLADTAFGLASNTHGIVAAGINTSISYHAGSRTGDRLVARSTETTRSRSLGTYYVEVHRSDGKIVATLTGTGFITGDKHDLESGKYPSLKTG
jgi:phenylacetic acid degradation protein PaaD